MLRTAKKPKTKTKLEAAPTLDRYKFSIRTADGMKNDGGGELERDKLVLIYQALVFGFEPVFYLSLDELPLRKLESKTWDEARREARKRLQPAETRRATLVLAFHEGKVVLDKERKSRKKDD